MTIKQFRKVANTIVSRLENEGISASTGTGLTFAEPLIVIARKPGKNGLTGIEFNGKNPFNFSTRVGKISNPSNPSVSHFTLQAGKIRCESKDNFTFDLTDLRFDSKQFRLLINQLRDNQLA